MSLPKIANALEPRVIPEHKMWFNPLAPEPEEAEPVETEATTSGPNPKAKEREPDEAPAGRAASLKEAHAIVPKPDFPKVGVIVPEKQSPALTHNL